MTFSRARASSALSVVSLTLGLALVTGSGCELVAGVDRNKIVEPSTTTTGGAGPGGAGGVGAEGGGGTGGGPECTTGDDCPGADTDCATRTCNGGVCDTDFDPAGTAIQNQTPGDCQTSVCDGQGAITLEDDDTDVLDDMNECTADTCNMGTPVNSDEPAMTVCAQNGGVMCDGSGACVECLAPADCMSGICQLNACIPADCIDTVQNGTETDVDCGGMDCNPCADGEMCLAAADCQSGICTGNVCAIPTCSDLVQNGLETDVDCGGGTCAACATGLGCSVDADCIGGSCSGSLCLPTCSDLVVNNQETDLDCGGPNCAGCADGLICSVNSDCASNVCTGGICQVPTCMDTTQNGTETGTDCGGGVCPGCADGGSCLVGTDCASLVCTGNVCIAAGCSDLVENGTETDVDCGGATCPDCADGLGCNVGADCASGVCAGNVCQVPACGDGVINGTDVCDDGNVTPGDGCGATCTVEAGFMCSGTPSVCTTTCGDGIPAGMEGCDDGGMMSGNGCSATCTVEMGYSCSGTPSVCTPVCGDNIIIAPEACDDGNVVNGDCCSSTCTNEAGCEVEPNNTAATANGPLTPSPTASIKAAINPIADTDYFSFTVPGLASVKVETFDGGGVACAGGIDTVIELIAPNGMTVLATDDDGGINACSLIDPGVLAGANGLAPGTYFVHVIDFGNNNIIPLYTTTITFTALCGNALLEGNEECDGGAGCDATCNRIPNCSDGFVDAPETCDDGNTVGGDGCSAVCATEAGFVCAGGCIPICGNATPTAPETCDDGNNVVGDGCDGACSLETVIVEVEPNNTSADADASPVQLVGGNSIVTGAIAVIADVDRFRLTLATNSVVRFETFDSTGANCAAMTTTLRVFDAASVQLYTDNISGITSCSSIVVNLAAGTYYVQVEETGNNAVIAGYRLQVKVHADKGSESEPNNNIGLPDPVLGSDVYVFGGHQVNTDADFFAIAVSAGKDVRAEVIEGGVETCESNGIDSFLELFNAAGTSVANDDDTGRGFCSIIDGSGTVPLDAGAANLAQGTYYLKVRASNFAQLSPAGQFDYRLVVTIR